MSRSENFHSGADGVPLHQTHCTFCGEPVYYSAIQRKVQAVRNPDGSIAHPRQSETVTLRRGADLGLKEGWTHQDGMKRDHTADPIDGRDPEADVTRQIRGFDSAKIAVKRNMQQKFDTLHAQETVDQIAKDMGL